MPSVLIYYKFLAQDKTKLYSENVHFDVKILEHRYWKSVIFANVSLDCRYIDKCFLFILHIPRNSVTGCSIIIPLFYLTATIYSRPTSPRTLQQLTGFNFQKESDKSSAWFLCHLRLVYCMPSAKSINILGQSVHAQYKRKRQRIIVNRVVRALLVTICDANLVQDFILIGQTPGRYPN